MTRVPFGHFPRASGRIVTERPWSSKCASPCPVDPGSLLPGEHAWRRPSETGGKQLLYHEPPGAPLVRPVNCSTTSAPVGSRCTKEWMHLFLVMGHTFFEGAGDHKMIRRILALYNQVGRRA